MADVSVRHRHAHNFYGAKNLFVKIDCRSSAFNYQIRRDIVIALRNGFCLVCHKTLLTQHANEDNLMLLHCLLPKMANHWAKGRRNELNKQKPRQKDGADQKLIEVKVRP